MAFSVTDSLHDESLTNRHLGGGSTQVQYTVLKKRKERKIGLLMLGRWVPFCLM